HPGRVRVDVSGVERAERHASRDAAERDPFGRHLQRADHHRADPARAQRRRLSRRRRGRAVAAQPAALRRHRNHRAVRRHQAHRHAVGPVWTGWRRNPPMRTPLLRTFYPSPANEPDTGAAANDAEYDPPGSPRPPAARVLALVPAKTETLSREDEYAL